MAARARGRGQRLTGRYTDGHTDCWAVTAMSSHEIWLEGGEEAPDFVYQACIDIVLTHPDGAGQ